MLKLISWNVNGLRACVKKGFFDFFTAAADIFQTFGIDIHQRNMRILKAEHFRHFEDGAVYLNADGKRIFLRAFYDKLETVVSVGVQKKRMSYNRIIAEEIRKLIRHFRQDEKYKAFRQVR